MGSRPWPRSSRLCRMCWSRICDAGMDGWSLLRTLAQDSSRSPRHRAVRTGISRRGVRAIREGFSSTIPQTARSGGRDIAIRRAAGIRELRVKAREADQVAAMRELATTAADRILNPAISSV